MRVICWKEITIQTSILRKTKDKSLFVSIIQTYFSIDPNHVVLGE